MLSSEGNLRQGQRSRTKCRTGQAQYNEPRGKSWQEREVRGINSAKWSNIAIDTESTWHRAELFQNAEDEILLCFFLAENLGLS